MIKTSDGRIFREGERGNVTLRDGFDEYISEAMGRPPYIMGGFGCETKLKKAVTIGKKTLFLTTDGQVFLCLKPNSIKRFSSCTLPVLFKRKVFVSDIIPFNAGALFITKNKNVYSILIPEEIQAFSIGPIITSVLIPKYHRDLSI